MTTYAKEKRKEKDVESNSFMLNDKSLLTSSTSDLEDSSSKRLVSCMFYTACSVSMVLSNKAISTSLPEEVREKLPQLSVILFQCLTSVVLVELAKIFKFAEYPSFNLKTARSWLPLNLFFIGMLISGFLSLVYVSVPIVTVFKNLSNLVTVTGDCYIFGESSSYLVVSSVVIMTLGAVLSGANDLEFHPVGYFWMILNCLCTAGYVLYMRYASTNIKLPKFGMVYYNNLLSAMLLFPFCIMRGEMMAFLDPKVMTTEFIFWNCVAGFLGFALNFASLWCVSATSATTYAVIGSLNKIPITILGFVMFHAKMTQQGVTYIALASVGGLIYGYAKLQKKQ